MNAQQHNDSAISTEIQELSSSIDGKTILSTAALFLALVGAAGLTAVLSLTRLNGNGDTLYFARTITLGGSTFVGCLLFTVNLTKIISLSVRRQLLEQELRLKSSARVESS